jgi:hypothetical protein
MNERTRRQQGEKSEFSTEENTEPLTDSKEDEDLEDRLESVPGYGSSRYSRKTWLACCLAPLLAISAVLILTIAAGLFSPKPQTDFPTRSKTPESIEDQKRREAFVNFGKEYFAIAARADKHNEAGFKELEKLSQGHGSIKDVHNAFAIAAKANAKAAKEFRSLKIPPNLRSKDKLRQSLDTMAKAYEARMQACQIITKWNGNVNDRVTAKKYQAKATEINNLTFESLRLLGIAANDNGLTQDDVEKFLPKAEGFIDAIPFSVWKISAR